MVRPPSRVQAGCDLILRANHIVGGEMGFTRTQAFPAMRGCPGSPQGQVATARTTHGQGHGEEGGGTLRQAFLTGEEAY